MPKPTQVTRKQVLEWIENPVTLAFKEVAKLELSETVSAQGLGAYHPFQPERTQEILAGLNGAEEVWTLVVDALEGEGIMEEDDE
jgi:hypothetical protein